MLTPQVKEAFDEIQNNRLIMEIPPENPYVFAKAHSLSAIFYSRGLRRAYIYLWDKNRNELKEVLGNPVSSLRKYQCIEFLLYS